MRNFNVVGTLVVLWINTCGSVKDDKLRNIPGITQKEYEKEALSATLKDVELFNTRAKQDSDFEVLHGGSTTLRHQGIHKQRQRRSLTDGNSPSISDELAQQRNINSGNAIHRLFTGKISAGSGVGGGRSRGGRSGPISLQEAQDNDQERVPEEACCIRRPHHVSVGYDAFGEETVVDVGKCRRVAKSVVAHLSLVGSNPDSMSRSELLELIAKSQTQCAACDSGDSCSASRSRNDRLNLYGGLKEIAVVEECTCVHKPSQCERLPQYQVFFPDSPYETTVDVGSCLGHCKSRDEAQTHCRPTRNRTVTVEGPMGDHCVKVIESCECSPECYRASYVESYYALEWNSSLSENQEVVMEIDVGRCAGGCESNRSVKCLMGSGETPGSCLMGLYGRTSCVPRAYTSHEFTKRDGKRTAVLSVDSCQCQ